MPLSTEQLAQSIENNQLQIMFSGPNSHSEHELLRGYGEVSAKFAHALQKFPAILKSDLDDKIEVYEVLLQKRIMYPVAS